jgi:hypothetical protein
VSTIQQQRMTGFQKAFWIIVLIFALGTISSVFGGSSADDLPTCSSIYHGSAESDMDQMCLDGSRTRMFGDYFYQMFEEELAEENGLY